MNTKQISSWLGNNTQNFAKISVACGVSIPTLYSVMWKPESKRQKRIIEALNKYISEQKAKK